MSIRITDTVMISDETRHRAEVTPFGQWAVSWLPGRLVDRSQATTAMVVAETVAVMVAENADHTHHMWPFLDNWAAELGLTGAEAMARVTEPEVAQDALGRALLAQVEHADRALASMEAAEQHAAARRAGAALLPAEPGPGPESSSRVTTIAVAPQVQVVVTAGHAGTDQVGLTLRGPHTSITVALSTPLVDALGEALAAAAPVPYVPAELGGGR